MELHYCSAIGILYIISSFITSIISYEPRQPIVYTKYGPVIGSLHVSRGNREFMAFRGIPYAKPPVGTLRFKAPQPPDPWSFAINGTQDAPFCIQKNYLFANHPKVEGQEDCLYLNVYVPVKDYKLSSNLPVMVFIHWGAFLAGRGASDIIGPEYLMDKDVIVVTLNYRLGVFGFFSSLDDNAPGNSGLKDQVLALKFIQENIGYFGGNENRVTIWGQSAGSGSVSLHLVSPASSGLFQQAISQSGVSLNLWAKPFNSLQPNVTAALATFVGCAQHLQNNADLVECLQKVDAVDLADSADKFKYFQVEPLTPYTFVIETKTEGNPEPFLTKDPLEYLLAGEFQKVPYIIGSVQDEGILRAASLIRQPDTLNALNANFTALIPQMLLLEASAGPNATGLFNNLVDFYLQGKPLINVDDSISVQGFIDLYSDRAFAYGIYQAVTVQLQQGHHPIWMYNFNYRGQYSYGDKFAATTNNIDFDWGVCHCDDLLYLLRSPALFPELDTVDTFVSEQMVTLWTNFAITGHPDPTQSIGWTSLNTTNVEVKNEDLYILNITGSRLSRKVTFEIQNGYLPERMNYWASLDISENLRGSR